MKSSGQRRVFGEHGIMAVSSSSIIVVVLHVFARMYPRLPRPKKPRATSVIYWLPGFAHTNVNQYTIYAPIVAQSPVSQYTILLTS